MSAHLLAPERQLACAVLWLAVQDARGADPRLRGTARAFLAGGDDFQFWCAVAELDPDVVQARAREDLLIRVTKPAA